MGGVRRTEPVLKTVKNKFLTWAGLQSPTHVSDSNLGALIAPEISRSIDVIRGAAGIGVIWGHSMYGLSLPVELNGAFWVWIFLPISGYLVGRGFISGAYEATVRGFGRFFFNRALRILPLAYVALVIGFASLALVGGKAEETVVRQFLFLPPGNNMSLVGALWTVAVEMQFYLMAILLVPLVCKIWQVGGIYLGAVVCGGALFLSSYWIRYSGDVLIQPRTFLGNIVFFIFGLLLANITVVQFRGARLFKPLFVSSLIVLAWWLQNYKVRYFWGWGWHNPIGGGGFIALIIVAIALLITSEDQGNATCDNRLIDYCMKSLARCGFYCYGIYVWHAVFATVNNQWWQVPPGPFRLGLLLMAVAVAPLSYKFIEKPILRFKMLRS